MIDERVANSQRIIIGSGKVKSKLSVPTQILLNLLNSAILSELAS